MGIIRTRYTGPNGIRLQSMHDAMKIKVETKLQSLASVCRAHGLALTVQRRVILENLAGRTDHPTADQIYSAIKDRLPGISRTTVYRVLEAFVDLGIIQRISNPGATARFDADTKRHHHLVCLRCQKVSDLMSSALNNLPIPSPDETAFHLTDYSITFTGTCLDCHAELSA